MALKTPKIFPLLPSIKLLSWPGGICWGSFESTLHDEKGGLDWACCFMVSHKRVSSRPEWNCWYSLFKTWQTRPGSPHCAMQWSSSPAPDPLEHFSLVFPWPRVSSFPVFWSVNYQFVGVWRKGCVERVFFLKAFQIQDEKDLQMLKRRNFFFPSSLSFFILFFTLHVSFICLQFNFL